MERQAAQTKIFRTTYFFTYVRLRIYLRTSIPVVLGFSATLCDRFELSLGNGGRGGRQSADCGALAEVKITTTLVFFTRARDVGGQVDINSKKFIKTLDASACHKQRSTRVLHHTSGRFLWYENYLWRRKCGNVGRDASNTITRAAFCSEKKSV